MLFAKTYENPLELRDTCFIKWIILNIASQRATQEHY